MSKKIRFRRGEPMTCDEYSPSLIVIPVYAFVGVFEWVDRVICKYDVPNAPEFSFVRHDQRPIRQDKPERENAKLRELVDVLLAKLDRGHLKPCNRIPCQSCLLGELCEREAELKRELGIKVDRG